MESPTWRVYVTEAVRYWEPRRIAYNLVLAVVVVAYYFAAGPSLPIKLNLDRALFVFLLAVLANVRTARPTFPTSSRKCQASVKSGYVSVGFCSPSA